MNPIAVWSKYLDIVLPGVLDHYTDATDEEIVNLIEGGAADRFGGALPAYYRRMLMERVATERARQPRRQNDVYAWNEDDFRQAVRRDIAASRTGGYRSVAKGPEGWGPTALLRRWQKVSGGKPWPSGRNAPPHRDSG